MPTAPALMAPAAARTISREAARRFLVLRHLLAPPRSLPPKPESVLTVVERLGTLQFDPLEIAGRNHDLVLLSRIAGYRREWTDHWLYEDRRLYETYNKGLSIVPVSEMPWFRLTWERNHERLHRPGEAFDTHSDLVEELLTKIRDEGPLLPRTVAAREAIEWSWRRTNQVRAILEGLAWAGILGIRERQGNLRVYDFVERLFPAEVLEQRLPEDEQRLHRLLSRYRGGGLLGTSGNQELWVATYRRPGEKAELRGQLIERGEIVPVAVEGIKGDRFVVREDLAFLEQAEREVESEASGGRGDGAAGRPGGHAPGVAFIAPLDPFVWDRDLLRKLFEFDYLWEVYVPEAKRRWGYYVLPILYGDRLVGRIEPRIERKADVLNVVGLWWEDGFDPMAAEGLADAFAAALEVHRAFGGVRRIVLPKTPVHRRFAGAVEAALPLAPRRSRNPTRTPASTSRGARVSSRR